MELYNIFYDCQLKAVHLETMCETEKWNKDSNFILVKSNISISWMKEYIDQNFRDDHLALKDLQFFCKCTDENYKLKQN
jgi:hypothetical protein